MRQAARARARQPLVGACVRTGSFRRGLAIRLAGALGWYFALAERVSEGRQFLEAALAAAKDEGPIRPRIEVHAWLCFFATEEVDLEHAIELGERGLVLAATASAPLEAALTKVALSLAYADSGDHERAAELVEEARDEFRSERDTWGMALSALVRGGVAARAGDVSTVAAMTEEGRRYAEEIGYEALQPPSVLFEAWVAQQRGDREAEADAYRRAFDVSSRAGFRDHASFALAGLGSVASRAATCGPPRSSSDGRSALPCTTRRAGSSSTPGRSSHASSPPAATSRRRRSCTEASSSGRSGSGRIKVARRCFSRSPAVRARRL